MHEGAFSRRNPRGSISLQEFLLVEVTYSSGDMVAVLQEVLSKTLQFNDGVYEDLPYYIKFILDNLQAAFTIKHQALFQKTLKALELHLVNLEATNEALISRLFGKEDIHSMDKRTIMGTNYARLSLKTQSRLKGAIANLPTEIQTNILGNKAMFESFTNGSNISRYQSPLQPSIQPTQMTHMASLFKLHGKITLGAVLE